MERILITGFRPFGDYAENTSGLAARNIRIAGPYSIERVVVPVYIFGKEANGFGKHIVKLAREIDAKAIISLGMASDIRGVRIESTAVNWVENDKYCLKSEQRKVIDKKLSAGYPLTIDFESWDITKIMSELKASGLAYESEISDDAGTYCCNALMFRILKAMQDMWCTIPYLFLRLPCTAEAVKDIPDFSKDKHLTSLPEIAKTLTIFMDGLKAG